MLAKQLFDIYDNCTSHVLHVGVSVMTNAGSYLGGQGQTWHHGRRGGPWHAARRALPATYAPGALSGKQTPTAKLSPNALLLPSAA